MSRRKPKYTELTAQVAAIKVIRDDLAKSVEMHTKHKFGMDPAAVGLIVERIDAALAEK